MSFCPHAWQGLFFPALEEGSTTRHLAPRIDGHSLDRQPDSVLNRGAFTLLVESYLERAEQNAVLPSGSLLVMDADHFKLINDTLGHQQGDEALKIISQTTKRCLGPADLVGRVGGEEFGVFLPGAALAEASKVAKVIRSSIRKTEFPAGTDFRRLSVSVGGVPFQRIASYDELFSIADQGLYQAKASGRDRIRITESLSFPMSASL
jgi:diguanylate cyclase (GGDEF)-like protein